MTDLVSSLKESTSHSLNSKHNHISSVQCDSYDHKICQVVAISNAITAPTILKKKIPKQWGYNLPKDNQFPEADEEYDSSEYSPQIYKKKKICSYKPLFYEIHDEPIFILWGNCYLDLRGSWDLDYQKEAGWNKFIKMGWLKASKEGVTCSMSQMIMPKTNLNEIKDTLLMMNNQQCKNLADIMIKYEEVIAMSINYVKTIKQKYIGKEEELEHLLLENQTKFDEEKKQIIQSKDNEGNIYLALTSCIDFKLEQIIFREVLMSDKFLTMMGVTQQEFQQISLRKGGLEFFQVGEHVTHIKNVLDLITSGKKYIEFDVRIKTYDNINLSVTLHYQIYQPSENLPFFVGGDYLLIQTFILSPNMLNYLHATRSSQIRNPFIEWEHDFQYSSNAQQLVSLFYQDQYQILKKKQKITSKYLNRLNKENGVDNVDKNTLEEDTNYTNPIKTKDQN